MLTCLLSLVSVAAQAYPALTILRIPIYYFYDIANTSVSVPFTTKHLKYYSADDNNHYTGSRISVLSSCNTNNNGHSGTRSHSGCRMLCYKTMPCARECWFCMPMLLLIPYQFALVTPSVCLLLKL
uniref:Uncharacterized protein n=1 Tax=Glossina austeni TaxID=7395 RepID=A0A1A9V9T6_GLOAU